MTFQAPLSTFQSRSAGLPSGVLMDREVSDHRWHFLSAMRSLGASIATSAGLSSSAYRRPDYMDFIDCNIAEPLALARSRAAWGSRPGVLIVLVSPGPKLADLLRLAASAEMIVVVVAREDDWIGTRALRMLQAAFVCDGEELVRIARQPSWPRVQPLP